MNDLDLNTSPRLKQGYNAGDSAAYAASNGAVDGATTADLKRGFVRGDHTHEPFGGDEDQPSQWEYRKRGGFLTRPIGDER